MLTSVDLKTQFQKVTYLINSICACYNLNLKILIFESNITSYIYIYIYIYLTKARNGETAWLYSNGKNISLFSVVHMCTKKAQFIEHARISSHLENVKESVIHI